MRDFLKKYFNMDLVKLKFLNLTKLKWFTMFLLSLFIVIKFPWLVQFILNTLFLITSFVIFLIIYAIVTMLKDLSEENEKSSTN